MRIPGIENLRAEEEVPGVPAPVVPVAPDEADDVHDEFKEHMEEQTALLQAYENLLVVHGLVSKEGVTPTLKAVYGPALEGIGVDLNASTEGVLSGISDTLIKIRQAVTNANDWFRDKFLTLVDAQYEGLKELTKWSKQSAKILAAADEKAEEKKVRAWPRAEMMKLIPAAKALNTNAKSLFGDVKDTNTKELQRLVEAAGGKVVVAKSKTLNIDLPIITYNGNAGIAGGISSKSIGSLGYSKKTIKADVDEAIDALSSFVKQGRIWMSFIDSIGKSENESEKLLAKGEDKQKLAEMHDERIRHRYMIFAIKAYGEVNYGAMRQIGLQMQRVANSFGKAE